MLTLSHTQTRTRVDSLLDRPTNGMHVYAVIMEYANASDLVAFQNKVIICSSTFELSMRFF